MAVQRPRSTRSSTIVTLARPPSSSSIHITDRSLRNASPCLWNQLCLSLRQPSGIISDSPIPSPITSSYSDSPLCPSITPSLFHSRFKTYLFHKFYHPVVSFLPPGLPSRTTARSVCFSLCLFFVSVPCAGLSWLSCQLWSARIVSYRILRYSEILVENRRF